MEITFENVSRSACRKKNRDFDISDLNYVMLTHFRDKETSGILISVG